MTASIAERQNTDIDFTHAIHDAAEARATNLTPERLEQLVGIAEYTHNSGGRSSMYAFKDTMNCVTVEDIKVLEGRGGSTTSEVDFAPFLDDDGDVISGDTFARPERATQYTLMALRGLQNYVLLVDAGVIEKPAVLVGSTNLEMAHVAKRIGMLDDTIGRQSTGRQSTKIAISGGYEDVSEKLFSDDTKKLEGLLVRRLASQHAGALAVNT